MQILRTTGAHYSVIIKLYIYLLPPTILIRFICPGSFMGITGLCCVKHMTLMILQFYLYLLMASTLHPPACIPSSHTKVLPASGYSKYNDVGGVESSTISAAKVLCEGIADRSILADVCVRSGW